MYNFPIFSQLILLLHWVLVTINDFLAGLGLGYSWTWGLAIIGLTIIVRLILFPLTWKQYKSAQQMQMIQPQIKELQKKYKSDRGKLQEETMKLYSEHRVESVRVVPAADPAVAGVHQPLRGDQGPRAAVGARLPGVRAGAEPGALPLDPAPRQSGSVLHPAVLYVVTQMISTELMVATQSDSTQKWIMRAMPIMFVLFLFRFPAGLFVYWVTTNVWTIGQQLIIKRTMPKPEELARQAQAKPKKRSRFMEVMMASQGEAMKQREEKMGKKGDGTSTAKQGSVAAGAKKPASGAKKPPPGKAVKRKQVAGGKPGQSAGAKPKSGAGQPGKARPAGQQPKKTQPADKPADGAPGQGGDGGTTTSADGPADE